MRQRLSNGNEALVAGVAGLVAGAMSMAAGEYVSVSSQSDTEHADLARETKELASDPSHEKEELAQIYAARGVEIGLARQVAVQLMTKDALGAHSRDELGISEATTARPVQAAMASAATFTVGAAAPLILVVISPSNLLLPVVAIGSLVFLALLGMIGAKAGGAGILTADDPRDVLGRPRHGADHRDRRAVRQGRLKFQAPPFCVPWPLRTLSRLACFIVSMLAASRASSSVCQTSRNLIHALIPVNALTGSTRTVGGSKTTAGCNIFTSFGAEHDASHQARRPRPSHRSDHCYQKKEGLDWTDVQR